MTVIQRFGSALNLNVHIHSLIADGVWTNDGDGSPRFVPLRLRDEDVLAVLRRVERCVFRAMVRRGLLGSTEDECVPTGPEVEPERQLELGLVAASASLRVASGPRAGLMVRRVGRPRPRREGPGSRRRRMQARFEGFDLHAGVRIGARQRDRLEKLSRYLLRPSLCLERLSLREDGLYQYLFKRPWSDGTSGVVLSPHELMEKLAALIPIPRANLVRYHGVLAPAAHGRKEIVPQPTEAAASCRKPPPGGWAAPDRVPWAQLLRRVFGVDVLRCAGCGGRRRLVAEVTDPAAIAAILDHLGLEPDTFGAVPARAPPYPEVDWAS